MNNISDMQIQNMLSYTYTSDFFNDYVWQLHVLSVKRIRYPTAELHCKKDSKYQNTLLNDTQGDSAARHSRTASTSSQVV